MSNEEVEFDAVDGTMTTVSTRRKSDANWLTSVHGSFTIPFRYPLPFTKTREERNDHVGGTGVFPEAQVICHAACQAVFDLDVGGVAPEKVDVRFTDSLRVDFRGPPVDLHYYGPGDGFASIVVHLPEERIAFTADLYERRALTPGKWMDDANYLAILRVLKELQKKTCATW